MNREPGTDNRASFAALPTAVQWSHLILSPRLRPGDVVVDATAGNGYDTLFLAERVLPGGRVFTFDVQAEAIEATRARLVKYKSKSTNLKPEAAEQRAPEKSRAEELAGVILHHAGHERMTE